MQPSGDSAAKVAEFLLQIKAIKLQPKNPFTWSSGWISPIYCDNRIVLSFPKIRTHIRQEFVRLIDEVYGKPDAIAGVATGGIAMGALVAQEFGLPFAYVRNAAKGHGMENLIEGRIDTGQSVIIVEDLVSTGKSSLSAVKALREHGCEVKGMLAVFTYGFDLAEAQFAKANCPLETITNYEVLIEQAARSGYVSQEDVALLEAWRKNPETWGQQAV